MPLFVNATFLCKETENKQWKNQMISVANTRDKINKLAFRPYQSEIIKRNLLNRKGRGRSRNSVCYRHIVRSSSFGDGALETRMGRCWRSITRSSVLTFRMRHSNRRCVRSTLIHIGLIYCS